MSEWVEELSKALVDEFADSPHVCTLATIDKNGAPRVRSVICRKISPDGSVGSSVMPVAKKTST